MWYARYVLYKEKELLFSFWERGVLVLRIANHRMMTTSSLKVKQLQRDCVIEVDGCDPFLGKNVTELLGAAI